MNGLIKEKLSKIARRIVAAMATLLSGGFGAKIFVVIDKLKKSNLLIGAPRMGEEDKIVFIKRLAILIDAGIPIIEAMSILERQAPGASKKLIAQMRFRVEQGFSLAGAMEDSRVFAGFPARAARIGEAGGGLAANLHHLAGEMRKRRELKRNITGAMIYPAMIFVVTIVISALLAGYVFPKIMPVFASLGGNLPASTRAMIAIGRAMENYWAHFLAAMAAMAAGCSLLIKKQKVKMFFDRAILMVPLTGAIFKNYQIANASRILAMALKSQAGVIAALNITKETTGNLAYRAAFDRIALAVSRGETIGQSMEKEQFLFPPLASQMIFSGEASGKLELSLEYLAQIYEDELNRATKNLSLSIEPAMMVFMGILVGFVAVSIITPIYGITQNLRQ